MQTNIILHKDYTLYRDNYQLVLPLELAILIPADDSVRLLSQFIEMMFLGDLYRTYCREGHANEPTPRQMLKIMIYAYMNHKYSSREIESACQRDINFMWLLEGAKAPDHSTIARWQCNKETPTASGITATNCFVCKLAYFIPNQHMLKS